ncbi:MAG: NUDIX hydrolase [Betaproteobacteria bacterium]|nr:NUDIX hydrolase [Betaproteobacteria bacterium]
MALTLNRDIIHTTPRDAASIIMLRDGPIGLEVFLLKRHSASEVLGGAYVFPGGKVDVADSTMPPNCLNQSPSELHKRLCEAQLEPRQALGIFVAALREAFEECGVLFADPILHPELVQQAHALHRQGTGFSEVLARLGMKLKTECVLPWTRWVTSTQPSMSNKRFDARFFVAQAPELQTAKHDNYETTDSVWIQPRAALEQYWNHHITLAPPQIMSLAHLSRHACVQSVLNEALSRPPALVQTEPFDDAQGQRVLRYPGDPEHSQPQRVIPGPTRLHHRNERFEPSGGFEALFAD